MLGVLKLTLSTEDDFQVLAQIQRFIWVLAFIVSMPLIGILVIGATIKDKNKLLTELHEANEDIKKTYNDLNETKYYLEMILNNSKAIIITTDTDSNIVEFNREAETLLEYMIKTKLSERACWCSMKTLNREKGLLRVKGQERSD